ncbi:unnamed protein product [Cyprideis torosa]|uniref:Uncharacterized protein n=1 Tax=Cyprideis torosa TaxID=163714 RepID=A0A7R8WTD5_9CRUS|nr:unnamed protein product [Cyprideis torosa]CAG0908874.1 unnamed protein product [Cyprideis torosa]
MTSPTFRRGSVPPASPCSICRAFRSGARTRCFSWNDLPRRIRCWAPAQGRLIQKYPRTSSLGRAQSAGPLTNRRMFPDTTCATAGSRRTPPSTPGGSPIRVARCATDPWPPAAAIAASSCATPAPAPPAP